MVSAISVANEFIRLGMQDGNKFTPMQLLKLVYISHGWMLGFFNQPLINENIEAWKYGPVIPDLYQAVKNYGRAFVDREIPNSSPQQLTDEEKSVINFVYRKYGNLDGIRLSMITHQPGTPWSRVFSHEGWGDFIPNDVIRGHYSELRNKVVHNQ